jgi:hypothetical protein
MYAARINLQIRVIDEQEYSILSQIAFSLVIGLEREGWPSAFVCKVNASRTAVGGIG